MINSEIAVRPMPFIENIKAIIDRSASEFGESSAYQYKRKREIVSKSFIDVKNDTERFANIVKKLGLLEKHIAVIGATSYEWLITYYGTVSSNSVIVPIDKELPPAEVTDLLDRADVSAVVFDENYLDSITPAIESSKKIKYFISMQSKEDNGKILSFGKLMEESEASFSCVIDREKMTAILFTSGTTGKSKGVMLSHKSLCDNVTCIDMNIPSGLTVLSVLPVHHAYCFTCDFLLGLYLGETLCFNDTIMHLAKNLQIFKPDIMLLVPMIIESVYYKINEAAKADPNVPKAALAQGFFGGRLKTIFSGGAYLDPKLIEAYKEFGVELLQGYGMTECSPRIACNITGRSKDDSVGNVVCGCEVKIVDGEICVKSDSVMLGYYNNPEETANTLKDGFLYTGDMGYVDGDNFLYITGRKKNLIILANGENVSPEQLENYFSGYLLAKELMIYSENGVITAEIYPNYEFAAAAGVDNINAAFAQKIDEINQGLPLYMRINGVKVRESEFDKTASGKIKRKPNT